MNQLLEAWEQPYGAWAEDLMDEGREAVLLKPLADHPDAALAVIEHIRERDSHKQRKLAASLAGHLGARAPADLLSALFRAERARDEGSDDALERLTIQSVVEDLVFAATRWCASDATRAHGIALLTTIVDDTVGKRYWNTASYAMATLLRHDAAWARPLLVSFAELAAGSPPDHPSRPSLTQEREFAARLAQGDPGCLRSVESHLEKCDAAAERAGADPETKQLVARFLEVAAGYAAPSPRR
jgi:hypothetical protein